MPFSRILIPLDGSDFAEQALLHAGRMARTFSGRVFLIQALCDSDGGPGGRQVDSVDWRLRRVEAQRYLRALAEDERLAGIEVSTEVLDGRPAEVIDHYIEGHGIDLVILSAWGAGGQSELPYGGTVHKVLATIRISWMIVRDAPAEEKGGERYRRIMVPLDGSRLSEIAVQLAGALDRDGEATLDLLHIVREPIMPRHRPLTPEEEDLRARLLESNRRAASAYLEELRDHLSSRHKVEIRLETAASPVDCIARICSRQPPDLLIMAVHNGDSSAGWSSDAVRHALLARTTAPVLALPKDMRIGPEFSGGSQRNG